MSFFGLELRLGEEPLLLSLSLRRSSRLARLLGVEFDSVISNEGSDCDRTRALERRLGSWGAISSLISFFKLPSSQ